MEKKRILVAPNSFKECADSVTIAKLIESNLRPINKYELIVKPISDGGDGFLKVCQFYYGGEYKFYKIVTPYDNSAFECPVLYCEEKKKLFIESAEVLGLKKVPTHHRIPMKLSSRGMGQLLRKINEDVHNRKIIVEKVYIGVGGTAVVDMGLGMMSELALKLFDTNHNSLDVLPLHFPDVNDFSYKKLSLEFDIILIVDVDNPLLGNEGGLGVYSRQKGASDIDIQVLEKSFIHLINLFENKGLSVSSTNLSGSGGGLSAAF